MPAKDRLHDTVVRALQKEGWRTKSQVEIVLRKRRLWVDIRAIQSTQDYMVLLEVKGFERMRSPIDYLASAIGKYVLYRAALEHTGIRDSLYLAVPIDAYRGILSEPVGEVIRLRERIKLMVFDPIAEEILQWIE